MNTNEIEARRQKSREWNEWRKKVGYNLKPGWEERRAKREANKRKRETRAKGLQQQYVLKLIDAGKSQSEVAALLGVSPAMICRLVSERRVLAA